MMKLQKLMLTAGFCVMLLCSSFSQEVIAASGKEEETMHTEELQQNDPSRQKYGLLEGLQLNDPEDILEAGERILKKDPDEYGKVIDSHFHVKDYYCEAGIVLAAWKLLKYREGDEYGDISDVIDSVYDHLGGYMVWDTYVFCPERKGDLAAVVGVFRGMSGAGRVCPRLICYTRDGGAGWDYYYTNDDVDEFTFTEDGCFVYLSEFRFSYGMPDRNKLVFCDTLNGEINEIDIGFDRRGVSLFEELDVETDILSIEDSGNTSLRQKLISIGYRIRSEPEDAPYFCTVRFRDDINDNVFDCNTTEILSVDEEFMRKLWIIAQSDESRSTEPVFYTFAAVDFVFPDSNERYLTREEIEEWKVFADRVSYHDYYLNLLERAKNEIYARKGFDFSKTGYTLFDQTLWYRSVPKRDVSRDDLNKFERYNVDLLEEFLKAAEEEKE